MKCLNCSTENPATHAFCKTCGAKLTHICSHCGADIGPDDSFCGACGSQLGEITSNQTTLGGEFGRLKEQLPKAFQEKLGVETEGENRLVTVLLSDMSGSVQKTRDLDPEDAAKLVSELLSVMIDVLTKYECRIDNIVGDEVVAVFGAPKTHENDPERAILAALEIIEEAKKLDLGVSVGINTGEAYFGGLGSSTHQKTTVYGNVINLAARLQAAADEGTVIVGEPTFRHAKRAFEFERRSYDIKGIDEPVTAYFVLKPLPKMDKVRGLEGMRAQMIGRDEELEKLKDLLNDVIEGEGRIATLVGEAGVGKSRMVSELRSIAAESANPPFWFEGHCIELGVTASYWVLIDLLRDIFQLEFQESESGRASRIVQLLDDQVAGGRLTRSRADTIGGMIGLLFSINFGTEWDEIPAQLSPDQITNNIFYAFRDLVLAIAAERPVVLVFEDLHWADSLSLDLITLLMDSLTQSSLLLLCIYRPEEQHKCWHLSSVAIRKHAERFLDIRLNELSNGQSRRLVSLLLQIDDLPDAVRELIVEKAQGNPFFVEEVVRSLIDSGLVFEDHGAWKAKPEITKVEIPNSIQSVILSRVDRLSDELRHLLQSASVIGRIFRSRVLAEVRGREEALEDKLHELEDNSLIHQERTIPELEFSFSHILTQETVYQTILKSRRATFHAEVARVLELLYSDDLGEFYEEIAYHFSRSEEIGKAVEYLALAAEKARRFYANEVAIEHCRRGLDLVATMPEGSAKDQLEIRLQLAIYGPLSLVEGHNSPKVVEACDRVIILGRSVGASHELLEALHGLASSAMVSGNMEKMYECVVSHHKVAVGLGDRATLMDDNLLTGAAAFFRGDFPEVPKYMLKVPELYVLEEDREFAAVRGHDPRVTSQVYVLLTEWMMGYPDRAKETYARARQYAAELDHEPSTRFAEVYYLMYFAVLRDYESMKLLAASTADALNRLSIMLLELITRIAHSCASFHLEPTQAALDEMAKRIKEYQGMGLSFTATFYRGCLAEAYLSQGDPAGALATIEETISVIEAGGERYWLAENHRLRGETLAALGRPSDEVAASFDRAIEVARSQSARMLELRAQISRVRALSGSAGETDAPAGLREVYDWFTEGFDSPEMLDAKALLHVPVPDN